MDNVKRGQHYFDRQTGMSAVVTSDQPAMISPGPGLPEVEHWKILWHNGNSSWAALGEQQHSDPAHPQAARWALVPELA